MTYGKVLFANVRFYKGLGVLAPHWHPFGILSGILQIRKPNKIKGLAIQRTHCREQQYIPDARAVGEEHDEAVDTVADAACGGHTEL